MLRISAIVALACSTAFGAPRPLTPEDIFQLEAVADPQVSPDGKRVLYVRQFADILADQRRSNLWIVNADGSGHRPLTTGNHSDSAPRWSPDGSQILFLSDRDGSPQIWRRYMDSGQMAKITSVTSAPSAPAWSPDGTQISFLMQVASPARKVDGMPAPPPGAKWADPPVLINDLIYRFNGLGYRKPGYTHLFLVPSEGGTPRQVSSGNYEHGREGIVFGASEAVWSADGKSLLMAVNRRDDADKEPLDSEVYEYSLDGKVKALTDRRGPDKDPRVSPDGKLIAYTGFDDKYQGYQVTKLYVMNRDGSGARAIRADYDRDINTVRWAPDGRSLYFLSDSEGNTGLYNLTLDGALKKVTANVAAGFSASGRAGGLSLGGGTLAFTQGTPAVPGDIAVGPIGGPTKIVTAVNKDLLSARELGKVEEIWYNSAKDNRRVQGWILKPPGFDPARKYPLILEIHGGPFANYGDRFDIEKQLMAAKGYVVLYTNPRGSTSYGGEFGNLIHHAYPGDDFYDLNSGVDAVIAKGYIDPDRVMVTGGSGGGVLTCWMIGRSTRFRAAVTVYPVINWYSFALTADIGNFATRYWFPGMPWDHVEHYEKRSLLSVVKNVKTPTLVLTGEEDYRTPMSESEQYYQALKLLGVETMLIRVPGEPHGIQRRPSHHVAKVLSILNWFERYR